MIICPQCSTQLPDTVRFCTECGSLIEEIPSDTSQVSKNRINNDPVESIKESGKELINEIGNFFNKSQSNNRVRTNICPRCSIQYPSNIVFCTECGTATEEILTYESTDQSAVQKEKTQNDELEYLEKLAGLRDKGIISDDEFEKKKKDILKL